MVALQIPEELAEMAGKVPGLNDRVARFIRLEVEQHRLRQKRFGAQTLELVARARENARMRRIGGVDRARVATDLKNAFDMLTEAPRD